MTCRRRGVVSGDKRRRLGVGGDVSKLAGRNQEIVDYLARGKKEGVTLMS